MKYTEESLCWWYPKVVNLNIPQPKTVILPFDNDELARVVFLGVDYSYAFLHELFCCADQIGYPLFLRTDITSFKQSWETSCFIKCEEFLLSNLNNLLKYSFVFGNNGVNTKN